MKDLARLAELQSEVGVHVRKMAAMNNDERHRYLTILVAPKTDSPSEIEMRAMLMTSLNELKLWPPRKGQA